MTEKVSAATGVSEESEAESKATEQPKEVAQPQSQFEAALFKAAKDMGSTLGEVLPVASLPNDEPADPVADPEPEETEVQETPVEGTDAEEAEADDDKSKKLSIAEQVAAAKARGEKPDWRLVRILEEGDKRRHDREVVIPQLTTRAEQAELKAQQLEAQLVSSIAPQPTENSPFADVYDTRKLAELESNYEKILEFATKNNGPDGAEYVLVGHNKDGSEQRENFTKEQIDDMRYKADRALRKDIPQRRNYIDVRAKADAQALAAYPQLKDPTSEMTREAITILKANRQLESVIGPECLMWIGHALRGRDAYLAQNGNGNGAGKPAGESEAARRIETGSKVKIAPTTMKSRSTVERTGSDLAALNKKLEQRGDTQSAEDYVAAALSKRASTAKKVQPIA